MFALATRRCPYAKARPRRAARSVNNLDVLVEEFFVIVGGVGVDYVDGLVADKEVGSLTDEGGQPLAQQACAGQQRPQLVHNPRSVTLPSDGEGCSSSGGGFVLTLACEAA